ncbi:MAG: hypothetical protein Q7S06_01860 [Nanoarchaeota archaeon]|nr:hypothetical protein [Nanoarchaeota archaeon]
MKEEIKKPDMIMKYEDHILFIEFKLDKEKEKEMKKLVLTTSGAILKQE